jgi:hypothetical protein
VLDLRELLGLRDEDGLSRGDLGGGMPSLDTPLAVVRLNITPECLSSKSRVIVLASDPSSESSLIVAVRGEVR